MLMKIKYILILSLALFSANSFADFGYTGDYCLFDGISNNPKLSQEEEFAMLLEPNDSRYFTLMADAVASIVFTPLKILKDPNCKISNYTKNLLEYYQKHSAAIRNNNQEIATYLDQIQENITQNEPAEDEDL